jgi:hypothetical protein
MKEKYKDDEKFRITYSTKDTKHEIIRDISLGYINSEYTEYMIFKIAKIENIPFVLVTDIVRVNQRDLTSR